MRIPLLKSMCVVVCLSLHWLAASVSANLCAGAPVRTWHQDEAKELEAQEYSKGSNCSPSSSTCSIGDRAYNEFVIACNRKRDFYGAEIDKLSKSKVRPSEATLAPRYVSKAFNYFGAFAKWYGYKVERNNGVWRVTSTLDFKWPVDEKTKLHISPELMKALSKDPGGADLKSSDCKDNAADQKSNGKVLNKDGTSKGSCRVDREAKYFLSADTSVFPNTADYSRTQERLVTDWVMLAWREIIQKNWSRNGFELKIEIANFVGKTGEISKADLSWARKKDAVYKVDLHQVQDRDNNMYRPIKIGALYLYRAIYAGETSSVISHEFGHSLGLDDEYAQGDNPSPQRDCVPLNGGSDSAFDYLMCEVLSGNNAVKSVYYWLVTQRYALGSDAMPPCEKDSDCEQGLYCDKGVAGIGNNVCQPKRGICFNCEADKQCDGSASCSSGKCFEKNVLGLNESCCRDQQCKTGLCEKNICSCKKDGDCASGEYCRNILGRNLCTKLKMDCESCANDSQCASDSCKSGKCVGSQEKTIAIGAACCRDVQCQSGLCEKDVCVCKKDSDCKDGTYCRNVLGQNKCVDKFAVCEECSKDSQCESGSCKVGKCIGKTERTLDTGEACCRDAQCGTGLCEKDICVCKKDSDCTGGKKCKNVLGQNFCK